LLRDSSFDLRPVLQRKTRRDRLRAKLEEIKVELAESLIDGECNRITRRCIFMALSGDIQAVKLCLERLLPPVRERPLPRSFKLPKLETLNDATLLRRL
jgi:hypothetical protein